MVLQSFIDVPVTSHFSLQNLPYGVFSSRLNPKRRIGVALGSKVVDLSVLTVAGLMNGPYLQTASCFHEVRVLISAVVHSGPRLSVHCLLEQSCASAVQDSLNSFMALGKQAWTEAREILTRLLSAEESILRDDKELLKSAVLPEVSPSLTPLLRPCLLC